MKKLLAALLASLVIFSILAGCAGDQEEPTPAQTSTAPTTAPAVIEAETELELNAIELPLTTEPIEFTMWTRNATTFDGFADYYDNEVYKEMEKLTGVKMNFVHPIIGSENENFQLMLVSDDTPDFIHGIYNYYVGGMDLAIEDGFIVALNDYAKKYMPNYLNRINQNVDSQLQSVTDTGNLWGVHHLVDLPQGSWAGLGIRQDWLDDAGLASPKTISELENALTVFRDNYTLDKNGPFHLSTSGLTTGFALIGSYNVAGNRYINVDGTVKYSPMEPGFKEYLMLLADWYKKGLVDKDSVTTNEIFVPAQDAINGVVGVFEFVKSQSNVWKNSATDPNFRVVSIPAPLPEGKTYADIHVRQTQSWVRPGNSMAISTSCENLEIASKYWDYFFTDEGFQLANWGPEGLSRTYDSAGNPIYNETAMAFKNITYTQTKYALHNQPVFTRWRREEQGLNEDQREAWKIWGVVDDAYMVPENVTLTQEEGAEHSQIKSTLDTFVSENVGLFITGAKSFDQYDAYLAEMKSIGVDRAVELNQIALDRYLARAQFFK